MIDANNGCIYIGLPRSFPKVDKETINELLFTLLAACTAAFSNPLVA